MTPWSCRCSLPFRRPCLDDAQPEADERCRVRLRPGEDLQVVRLVLLRDADLEEPVELRSRPCRRPGPPGRRPRCRRSAGSGRGSSAARASALPWRSQSGRRIASSRATGCGVAAVYSRLQGERVQSARRDGSARCGRRLVRPRLGQLAVRPEHDLLLAVADEARPASSARRCRRRPRRRRGTGRRRAWRPRAGAG